MLQRIYLHNFRCLENFELTLKEMSSALLLGKNGTGKSTIASALEVLQKIGRGINRVGKLVQSKDFAPDRDDVPKLESYRKRLKGSKLILFTRGVDEAAEELLRAA